jgi:diguanylate cyclase (GGDEF)-like protein
MTEETDGPIQRLLSDLARSVDADRGAALYLDDGEGSLYFRAASNAARARLRLPRLVRGQAPSLGGAVELLSIPDVRGGLLVLERTRDEPFSAEDRAVGRLYARQLADEVAVGVVSHPAPRLRQLEGLLALAAELSQRSTEQEVATAVCAGVGRVIEADNARIHVLSADAATLEPIAFHAFAEQYRGETLATLRIRAGQGITGWVAAHDRSLIVPDAGRDRRALTVPGTDAALEESMLLAPIRHEGSAIGVIALSRLGVGRFGDDDLWLLERLADTCARSIGHARLLASRDRLVGELATLLDISKAGSAAQDELTLARTLAAKLRVAARVDACTISSWDEGSTLLHTLGSDGTINRGTASGTYDVLEFPLTRRVLLDGQPQVVQADAPEADRAERRLMATMGARTLLMLPLVAAGRTIGLVELFVMGQRQQFSAYELNVYRTMTAHAASALENARLVAQLRQAADVDQLTGVANHRHLQDRLRQEIARSARAGSQFSVLMVDLDGFKAVNDRHGHADGDRVLRNVAAGLKLAVRASDIVTRYGGDEFVVLMPDTDERAAKVVARRVVSGVSGQRHQLNDGSEARLTCSVGLSVYPDDGRTATALLRCADAAMYAVKRAGGRDVRRGTRVLRAPSRAPTGTTP